MSTGDWRISLGFSDRLAAITKLQVALQSTPYANDALTEARRLERGVLESATSRDAYDLSISDCIKSCGVSPPQNDAFQKPVDDGSLSTSPGGILIGQYTNAHHHKDGLFSTIFEARDYTHHPDQDKTGSTNIVALKVTHPSSEVAPHDSRKEARLLQVATNTHVITLQDSFTAKDGSFVLVMPFLPFDLGMLLTHGPLSDKQGRRILADLMRGLTHVHGLGMIHRDVKPANILMRGADGPAYLGDFGIAWWSGDSSGEPSDQKILDVGTTCYRPPELLFGNEKYTTSLDMWAAGCVAAQVVSLGERTLFESGELGSDLALIKSIFETLGTPDATTWPEAATFPDWGKMLFNDYPAKPWKEILDGTGSMAIDFVSCLVRYESSSRRSASEARDHTFLAM